MIHVWTNDCMLVCITLFTRDRLFPVFLLAGKRSRLKLPCFAAAATLYRCKLQIWNQIWKTTMPGTCVCDLICTIINGQYFNMTIIMETGFQSPHLAHKFLQNLNLPCFAKPVSFGRTLIFFRVSDECGITFTHASFSVLSHMFVISLGL